MAGWAGLALALALVGVGGACKKGALGPVDSYLLLVPAEPAETSAAGLPVMERLPADRVPAPALHSVFAEGFASEMVRTVHLAKRLVRQMTVNGQGYPDAARASAADPLLMVVGPDGAEQVEHRGLALEGWFGGPTEYPATRWVALPANIEGDKALVQTLTGRLATHAADLVARGAEVGPPPPLVEAYRMAMEVIAREWRVGDRPSGNISSVSGTRTQRRLFAEVRENRAVFAEGAQRLRPAAELLSDVTVAATVIYRLAQTKDVANKVAPEEVYTPLLPEKAPAGVTGASILGPVRNFQAKLFTAWARAVVSGNPPADVADLVRAYGSAFPDERQDVLRIFLVTTFGATVLPEGVSPKPEDATRSLAELTALLSEVVSGKRSLRDATAAAPAN